VELVVEVATWMVHDGNVPELAVGDEWTTRLDFFAEEPLQPASGRAMLAMTPDVIGDSPRLRLGPWYRIVAKLRRRVPTDSHCEEFAFQVPGVVLGYSSRSHPVPSMPVVAGRGTLWADDGSSSASAFPETLRTWVVEAITLVTVPRPHNRSDWAHRSETLLSRTDSWRDDRGKDYVTYFVSVRLCE
jgi:hypothetical protein